MHIQVPTDLAQPALARLVHQLEILHHHHHQPGVYSTRCVLVDDKECGHMFFRAASPTVTAQAHTQKKTWVFAYMLAWPLSTSPNQLEILGNISIRAGQSPACSFGLIQWPLRFFVHPHSQNRMIIKWIGSPYIIFISSWFHASSLIFSLTLNHCFSGFCSLHPPTHASIHTWKYVETYGHTVYIYIHTVYTNDCSSNPNCCWSSHVYIYI